MVEESDNTYSLKFNITIYLYSTSHVLLRHMKLQNVVIAFCHCVYMVHPILPTRVFRNNWRSTLKKKWQSVQKRCKELQRFLSYTQTQYNIVHGCFSAVFFFDSNSYLTNVIVSRIYLGKFISYEYGRRTCFRRVVE